MRVNYYILLLPSLKKGEKKYETKNSKKTTAKLWEFYSRREHYGNRRRRRH